MTKFKPSTHIRILKMSFWFSILLLYYFIYLFFFLGLLAQIIIARSLTNLTKAEIK